MWEGGLSVLKDRIEINLPISGTHVVSKASQTVVYLFDVGIIAALWQMSVGEAHNHGGRVAILTPSIYKDGCRKEHDQSYRLA